VKVARVRRCRGVSSLRGQGDLRRQFEGLECDVTEVEIRIRMGHCHMSCLRSVREESYMNEEIRTPDARRASEEMTPDVRQDDLRPGAGYTGCICKRSVSR
jgi:hypothetical protein